ncbi:6648_t:CDS:2 [Dentiscutata heterogama]|uniref:6648_t:CDS:1 n=1 Tax=Dentiscutata heterogama TaxID=1316150 RepID=A0ACA9L732_9GLOM|nr:6648_t:CDS:2 [Dentiscutata heterogama]
MEEFESFANLITRSNSPDSETRSTSAKSDNETPNMPTIKKTKELDPMFNMLNEKSVKQTIHKIALLHYWDLSDGDAFLVCLLDLRCKKLMFATPTQRHQAKTALRNKYNKIKSLYKALTSSDKSFSPHED